MLKALRAPVKEQSRKMFTEMHKFTLLIIFIFFTQSYDFYNKYFLLVPRALISKTDKTNGNVALR